MNQADLFAPAVQGAEWHRVSTRPGRIYRWRLHADRIRDEWTDTRDPHHPQLWFAPPGWAFELEYASVAAGGWREVRNYERRWELWQVARETPEARAIIDGAKL